MTDSSVISIEADRLVHSCAVGRLAALLAVDLFEWNELHCQQMFLLGLVHDCGYEYVKEPSDHPYVGASLLEEAGFMFWREVRWHGVPHAPYSSEELLLLNIADLLVDSRGNRVTLMQRMSDIEGRYGIRSDQYIQAIQLAQEIDLFLHQNQIDLRTWGCAPNLGEVRRLGLMISCIASGSSSPTIP